MTFSVAEKKRKAHQPLKNLSLYSPKNDRHNDQRNEIGIIYIYTRCLLLCPVPGTRYIVGSVYVLLHFLCANYVRETAVDFFFALNLKSQEFPARIRRKTRHPVGRISH